MSNPDQREADRIANLIQTVAATNRQAHQLTDDAHVDVWWPTEPGTAHVIDMVRQQLHGLPIGLRTYPTNGCAPLTASQPVGARQPADSKTCCDMHNTHCEPPGDLCCWECTEQTHNTFPIPHADGSDCVMDVTLDRRTDRLAKR